MKQKIILASASKRRSRILKACGIPHTVIVRDIQEVHLAHKKPEYIALYNAQLKARAVAGTQRTGYVIGADTLVVKGKKIIGKPRTIEEARVLLASFSQKSLVVHTGLCLIDCKRKKEVGTSACTAVHVRKLNKKMISYIVKHLDPLDRAGGFSIEGVGAFIFDTIDGSFYNVLGLPTVALYEGFKKLGLDLLQCIVSSTQKAYADSP